MKKKDICIKLVLHILVSCISDAEFPSSHPSTCQLWLSHRTYCAGLLGKIFNNNSKIFDGCCSNYFWSEHNNEIFTSIRCTSIVTGELETPVQLDFLRFRTILMSDLEMLKCIFQHPNQESDLCLTFNDPMSTAFVN